MEQSAAAAEIDAANGTAAQQFGARAGGGVQVQNVAWTIAKDAIKAALRYGKNARPKAIRPWADKLYTLVEMIDNLAETGVVTSL